MRTLVRLLAGLLGFCAVLHTASAATYYLATNGTDQLPPTGGTATAPFRTWDYALARLATGDTLIVRPGVYFTAGNRSLPTGAAGLTLRAETPGTVTVSHADQTAREGTRVWTSLGGGVYSSVIALNGARFAHAGGTRLWNFATLADITAVSVPLTTPWQGQSAVKKPDYGFAFTGSTGTPANTVYVRLPSGANPNGQSLVIGRTPSGSNAIVRILATLTGAILIDGLTFEGSNNTAILNESASNVVIRNTVFRDCRYGVRTAANATVEWCEYFFPGFTAYADAVQALNTAPAIPNALWGIGKYYNTTNTPGTSPEGHLYTSVTNNTTGDNNLTAAFNYMHNAFEGAALGRFNNSEAHHSVYADLIDNADELEIGLDTVAPFSAVSNVELHHNLFVGIRQEPIGLQESSGAPLTGPVYVYRNVFVPRAGSGGDATLLKTEATNATYAQNGFFFYHNTLNGTAARLWKASSIATVPGSVANFRFFNNIFTYSTSVTQTDQANLNEAVSGNNLLLANANLGDFANTVFDPVVSVANQGLFVSNAAYATQMDALFTSATLGLGANPVLFDFTLESGSSAVDRGKALPVGAIDYVLDANGNIASVVGPKWDVGAFERGVSNRKLKGEWPRPMRTVFTRSGVGAPQDLVLPPYQQPNDAQGLVLIEAEDYHSSTLGTGAVLNFRWATKNNFAGFSGWGFIRPEDSSGNVGSAYVPYTSILTAPRADYLVNFTKSGTHYLWVRAYKTGDSDDSVHGGFNNAGAIDAKEISNFNPVNSWAWSSTRLDSGAPRATINVPSTGLHTVNLYMREDGTRIDRIILTTDPAYVP
jgi:hypothetical protein